jgi:hypothetical protein
MVVMAAISISQKVGMDSEQGPAFLPSPFLGAYQQQLPAGGLTVQVSSMVQIPSGAISSLVAFRGSPAIALPSVRTL